MHIVKFTTENTDFFIKALDIRTKVFVEEQQVDQTLEYDGNDPNCIHYLLFVDNLPAGTARRRFTENGIKLERLAILKTFRGKGFANDMMKYIMNDILPCNQIIYMHAQLGVEKIYEKHGFKIVGEMFTEADINHYKMEYNIS